MKLYSENKDYKLYHGSMLDMLEVIEPNTIDSIVCDPPYELNFMNKGWDNSGIAFQSDTWKKCYEVLKPGGYLLAFGGSRTFHRIACAIEDAGFEIRDTIMWLYGSGFPKSMSLSKGLEAREKLGNAGTRNKRKIEQACDTEEYTLKQTNNGAMGELIETTRKKYIPDTELAKQWQGWGTALKPSFEPIIVARKPFKGSLVDNVIEYGVGGINIDECRVETKPRKTGTKPTSDLATGSGNTLMGSSKNRQFEYDKLDLGRFPANTILTYDETDFDEVCGGFPNSKGCTTIDYSNCKKTNIYGGNSLLKSKTQYKGIFEGYNDSGSASRYFYCAKASKKDRDEGLDEFEEIKCSMMASNDNIDKDGNFTGMLAGRETKRKNTHPTVKPTDLMQYLVRLVTPNGGTVLDCFNGSGSTGKAVMYENREKHKDYKYIGIELTEEYLPIAKARIEYVCNLKEEELKDMQMSIFDFIGGE